MTKLQNSSQRRRTKTIRILFDENICVRCGACVSESEFGGVIFKDCKIFVDESKPESWEEIISICPTGAIKLLWRVE